MTDAERAEALNEQLAAAAKLIVRLTRERDEALRRRDAWKARAEDYPRIADALRAKTASKDSRTLGRALLGAAKVEAEQRAERLERERDEARADLRRLANAAAGVHNEVGAMIERDGMYEPSVPTFVAEELAELDAALREIMPRLRGEQGSG